MCIFKDSFLESIVRTLVILGITLIFYACATNLDNSKTEKPISLTTEDRLAIELLDEYREILSELSSETEDLAYLNGIGQLHFHIGNLAKDRKSIKKAVHIFEKVLEKEPDNAEIMAFLGSAYTIKARDFPMKWVANLTPIGFMRLYYVKKGINRMDAAIEMDEMNPVVRLIRGIACVNMSEPFGQFDKGIKDIELLLSWIENPSLNKRYAGIITDKDFMANVYYRAGKAYLKNDEKENAISMFKMTASISPDTPFGRAALRRLND